MIRRSFKSLIVLSLFAVSGAVAQAEQTADPVAFYRATRSYPAPAILLTWEADINGDGRNEVWLSPKGDYDEDRAVNQIPTWEVFLAGASANSFTESTGIQKQGKDVFEVGSAPMIDLEACFVGLVTELGQHAIVTEQVDNPRVGNPIARIYAYTLSGDHVMQTKLAEYDATVPNTLFDKYLKDGKRTVIKLVEVTQ